MALPLRSTIRRLPCAEDERFASPQTTRPYQHLHPHHSDGRFFHGTRSEAACHQLVRGVTLRFDDPQSALRLRGSQVNPKLCHTILVAQHVPICEELEHVLLAGLAERESIERKIVLEPLIPRQVLA